MPSPSHVAPSGNGLPGQTLNAAPRRSSCRSRRRSSTCAAPRTQVRAVDLHLDLARQLCAAGRAAPGRTRAAPSSGCERSSFERLERRTCLRVGHVLPENCELRTPAAPSRVASAIAGSMWSVKNWKGRRSPYSSPMNSSGVCGAKSSTAARRRSSSAGRRSPTARLPTWSWFCEQTISRSAGSRSQLLGEAFDRAVVRVVARRAPPSGARAARGGARRPTARRGPTPRSAAGRPAPSRQITSVRGSIARTRSASSASTWRGDSSKTACTASSRRPSTP